MSARTKTIAGRIRSLDDLIVGDKIVVSWGYPSSKPEKVTVERVIATQFTAGGVRYHKAHGYEVGESGRTANRVLIHYSLKSDGGLWTWFDADEHIIKKESVKECRRIASLIRKELERPEFFNSLSILKEAAELLGVDIS